jgi:hypothetical protein
VANLSPYTDGNAVYQARTLLEQEHCWMHIQEKIIIYNDENCASHSGGHKAIKKNKENIATDSLLLIYFVNSFAFNGFYLLSHNYDKISSQPFSGPHSLTHKRETLF